MLTHAELYEASCVAYFNYIIRLLDTQRTIIVLAIIRAFPAHASGRIKSRKSYLDDCRGCGLIGGIEIVNDKAKRSAFPAEAQMAGKLEAALRKHGLILRIIGNRIAFSPPLVITAAQVEEMMSRVKAALDNVLDGAA